MNEDRAVETLRVDHLMADLLRKATGRVDIESIVESMVDRLDAKYLANKIDEEAYRLAMTRIHRWAEDLR